MNLKNNNFFGYVEKVDKLKLVYLFVISLFSNLFEIFGIGLIPSYVFAISSFEEFRNQVFFGKNLLININFRDFILYSSIFLIIFFIFKNILTIFFYKTEQKIISRIVSNNAFKLFKFYLTKPYSFYETINPSEIIKNISISNTQAGEVLKSKILILKEITLIAFMFSILVFASTKLTITILFFLTLFSIVFYLMFKKKLIELGSSAQFNQKEQFQILNNTFNGIREVKIFKIEKLMSTIFDIETRGLISRENLSAFFIKLPRVFYEIIAIIFMIALIYVILYQNNNIEDSLPILSLYLVVLLRFIPSFTQLNSSINSINFHTKAEKIILEKFNEIDVYKRLIKKNNLNLNKLRLNYEDLDLNLKNLSFYYSTNKEKKIIDEFNLNISKGDKICLFGKSGTGKSTLIDLISGLLKPTSGIITLNNKNIQENIDQWLDLISYVPQKVFLFDDTLKQNIFFKNNVNPEELAKLNKILRELDLFEFIEKLPNKLDTKVGNMGSRLSGGQLQRIGIARALVRNPKIIILDEATNSLDKKTEEDILNIFNKKEYDAKIIISISHDQNIFKYFNRVIFIENGKIAKEVINKKN